MAESFSFLFNVQGMSCVHCLTKVKQLSVNDFGASNVSVNLDQGFVRLKAAPDFEVSRYLKSMDQLGFKATPMKEMTGRSQKKEGQRFLARIGVAGACTGNIMLISFALYSGADISQFSEPLSWLSFVLFLPVLFYSGFPILKQSWVSIVHGLPSVDIPLSLALVGGTILSVYNLIMGSDQFYFDSLSMFVFLILASRYFIYRIQQKHLKPISTSSLFGKDEVVVINNGSDVKKSIDEIEPGDLIRLKRDEFSPVDAELISSNPIEVNKAVLTGESSPEKISPTGHVPAGVQLYSAEALLQARSRAAESGLAKLIDKVNSVIHHKTPVTQLTDKLATYFTGLILLTVLVLAVYGFLCSVPDTVDRILALLVLSCPCALAIATPLAFSLAIKKGFQKGLLIKKADLFERCASVAAIGFDKTGTLTSGKSKVTTWEPQPPNARQRNIIGSLESKSHHPIAKAMLEAVGSYQVLDTEDWTETAGVGVEANIDGDLWKLERHKSETSQVSLSKNGSQKLIATIKNEVRKEAKNFLNRLSNSGYSIFVLTGDVQSEALRTAEELGLSMGQVSSELSPEDKSNLIKNRNDSSKTAYVGDGINDCLALANSHLSISMGGSPEATFHSSDVHLIEEDLSGVQQLIHLSRGTLDVIKKNLYLSFGYNVFFGCLAVSGLMNPLIAAVLMPISSVTVVGHTLLKLNPSKKGGSQ